MGTYKNILATTDFTQVSTRAMQQAADIARAGGGLLTVLYVIEHFPEDMDPKTFLAERARRELVQAIQGLDNVEVRAEVIASTRSAKAEIVHYAEKHGVDLIVIGTHSGHGPFCMVGSTANGVVHAARCDVLVVRWQA
jgi:universal stress protein A